MKLIVNSFFMFIVLTFSVSSQAHYINHYFSKLKNSCPKVNLLAAKKSVIALTRDYNESCEDHFSKIIIRKCIKVRCEDMYEWLKDAKNSASGNVIGS